ncbi:MAG: 4-hydroxy-2-oxovalerate aldolase [Chloroflexi bacterium]|nr:4-hydroxy-2-oxovalerate aldolase [Chloroflexota bacterium]
MNDLTGRRRALKSKLKKRERVFAGWTSLAHPSISEIFCRAGVDFVGIDIEHSTISQEQAQRIIAACQASGSLCLPRVASHNMEMIKRLLDSGADGIIVPTVSTPEEVERLVSWCKYSPEGKRGFGIARAQGYGFDFADYTTEWNKTSSLIIQIETVEGVNNIDRLLGYEAVDAAMVGPYDLSASLGVPGQLEHPRVTDACKRIVEACARRGKSCGTQMIEPDGQNLSASFALGYTFIVLSSDIFLLWKWSERMGALVRELRAGR